MEVAAGLSYIGSDGPRILVRVTGKGSGSPDGLQSTVGFGALATAKVLMHDLEAHSRRRTSAYLPILISFRSCHGQPVACRCSSRVRPF